MTPNPRRLWGLIAVGGATAVGITTHDAGFTVLTLIGGLLLPCFLGFGGHRHRMPGGRCGGHHATAAPPDATPVA